MKAQPYHDPVVEAYMAGVDRTLLRENLQLSFHQRALKHQKALQAVLELRRADKPTKAVR